MTHNTCAMPAATLVCVSYMSRTSGQRAGLDAEDPGAGAGAEGELTIDVVFHAVAQPGGAKAQLQYPREMWSKRQVAPKQGCMCYASYR